MRTFVLSLLAICGHATAFVPTSPPTRFSGTTVSLSRSSVTQRTSGFPLQMSSTDGKGTWDAFTSEVAKKFAVAAAVAAVAFSAPGDALAARSGGRLGGRSFSSPSRMSSPSRSYAPSRSYGGGGVGVVPVPVPMGGGFGSPFGYGFGSPFGSPFGFSPFGSPGVAFYGGGWGVSPVDILLLGGLAYGATQLVKGGSTGFGDLDDVPSSLGEGVDVLRLQVAINCRDRSRSSILGTLSDLSQRGDTESRSGLGSLVSEISLALARRQVDWVASASQLEHFSNRNAERAEATFSQYTIQVRSKIERETNAIFGGKTMSSERSPGGAQMGGPTVAVVTLVLALRGEELKRLGLDRSVSSVSSLRSALETVASSALTDGGENVLAAEVLWTPEEPWETLTREDVIEDFPQLLDI